MPYCRNCGAMVNDSDRFCMKCGTQRTINIQTQAQISKTTVNVYALKQVLLSTYNLADSMDAIYPAIRQKGHQLREFHKKDVMCFLLYLSAADGKVTSQEKDFLNILFDQNINEQGYVQLINSLKISSEYIREDPLTIQISANVDKTIIKQNPSGKLSAPVFIEFYQTAGQAIISCDGHTDIRETQKLNEYIGHLNAIVSKIMNSTDHFSTTRDKTEQPAAIQPMKTPVSQPIPTTRIVTDQIPKSSYSPEADILSTPQTVTASAKKTYPASIYKVGKDIPVGKYKVFSDNGSSAYYSVCNDPNGDDIVTNDNFINQVYVDIQDGQYLELSNCHAVPIKDAVMFNGTKYSDGEYLVGQEIAPGEYKVEAIPGEDGYYSLETFAFDGSRSIDTNRTFNNVAYVEPRQGQILVLKGCTLSL